MGKKESKKEVRSETGPMKFGEDWTGVFIRGDEAFAASLAVGKALQRPFHGHALERLQLQGLMDILLSCVETHGKKKDVIQKLKEYTKCIQHQTHR